MGSRWALITWSVPYNGNSEIMGYIIYIRNVQINAIFIANVSSDSMRKRQAMSSPTMSYNVTENILPAMLYQFIIVACNELGCGELGQPSPTIRTGEERKHNLNQFIIEITYINVLGPENAPVNCSATAINSTAIMITWSLPVMPNGIITDYNVSYVPDHSLSTADYSADGNVSVAIGNNDTILAVSSLRIATNYSVAIAAHTMIGTGPYSSNTDCTVQTMEDG